MTHYYEEPGLYTDQINPFPFSDGVNWPFLVSCGFKWASFQCYNPAVYGGTKEYDLAAVRAHGFSNVGVWGVLYNQSDFFNGGKQMGQSAVKQGAGHLIVDAEECYKNTRTTQAGWKIVEGIRAGGYNGPIDLSTLGSPSNPTVNDFGMDTKSFTDTGGSVQPQDYLNDYIEYSPKNSEIYWPRVGVPRARLNHTVGLYPGHRGKIDGDQWVTLLKEANVGKNFSVYQVQDTTKADFDALAAYIKIFDALPIPTPPHPSSSSITKAKMIAEAQKWLDSEKPNRHVFSRIRLAKRVLQIPDAQMLNTAPVIKDVLDDAGVPQ